MTDDEILYGQPGVVYHGLLTQPLPYRPTPPGTMTRQRMRAEARAQEKADAKRYREDRKFA